jgi:thiol-disulfide isomerase/thioredoxin
MMKRSFLSTIVILAIACFAIVAIGRYRRVAQPSSALTKNAGDVATIADVKPDIFIAAANAPKAPLFAEGAWLNSDAIKLGKLRDRVVLVEFWTFGCYNCRNTLPAVKQWDASYRDRGLTVVGVHTPELAGEYKIDNLRTETQSLGIKYPVVADNDYKTWNAYGVEAWPTMFVLDKQGRIRWQHIGEGSYVETENVIKRLLAE